MIFDSLKKEYYFEDIPYIGQCKLQFINKGNGAIRLKNHRWYKYSIKSDIYLPFGYRNLIIIPHRVTENDRRNVKFVIKRGKGVAKYAQFPHIDGNTGNIHDEKYNVEMLKQKKALQIICCGDGHSGPSIGDHLYEPVKAGNDFYKYTENLECNANGSKEIQNGASFFVPKAAYYPLYEKEAEEEYSFQDDCNGMLHKILKVIWERLNAEE